MLFALITLLLFAILIAYAFVILHAIEGWQSRELYIIKPRSQHLSADLITIVIPARTNSIINIPDLPVHIIVVNDHNEQPLQVVGKPDVEIIDNIYEQGKKHALHCGIEHAKSKYVITTDCDTRLTTEWFEAVCNYLFEHEVDMLIMPLKMRHSASLFEAMQETEYVALQTLTGGYAIVNDAIMCSGANMVVDREKWLASWDDILPDIPSGDDMFMLHSFKRQGLKIDFLKSPAATLEIQPSTTLKSLFAQRARWAGKAGRYTDRTTIKVALAVLAANLTVILFPPFVVIKWIIDLTLLWTSQRFFGFQHALLKSLLLSIVYPLYILTTLIIIPFSKNKW